MPNSFNIESFIEGLTGEKERVQLQNEYDQNFTGNPLTYANPGYSEWQNNQERMRRFAEQLADPQSQYYQQFRKFLASATPTIGTNNLLAPLMAGGGNQAASGLQANALRDEYKGERNDFLNNATTGFASQGAGLAAGISQNLSSNEMNQRFGTISANQNAYALNQNNPDFGDFALSLIPGATAFLKPGTSPGQGGGGGQMTPYQGYTPQFSDIRLKENIQDTGEKTKDGIRIVEFNYIWGGERFRGVIANEAQEVRPDLVSTINGYLAVNYGGL